MSLDANEISAVVARDHRIARFSVAKNVLVVRELLAEVKLPMGRITLGTVIDVGEKWLFIALWGEWLAIQGRATITPKQKAAISAGYIDMLEAAEERAKALRRYLYDRHWVEDTLKSLLSADGEARRLYEAKQLTAADLLRLEPGAFILLLAGKSGS
jgi:hypothetical protein